MFGLKEKITEAVQDIRRQTESVPNVALILGSGLGVLADEVEQATVIPYENIPHFPQSTVEGHAGRLVLGTLEGVEVVAMQGRFHMYEGYSLQRVTFPVYVMKALGAHTLVVTNAAGGMNGQFTPGDLMLISDHLNMTGDNPLIGPNDETLGPRFPDMSEAYSRQLMKLALDAAQAEGIDVQTGVYAGIRGPNYMTPQELIMLRQLGGDAVGMSTVPEVIVARYLGMEVLGITCITDMAIGEHLEPLTHERVVSVANRTRPRFIRLVKSVLRRLREGT